MRRSTERILTTHVGSLVRPPEIIRAMRAISARRPYDEEAFATHLERGVADVVRRQSEAGVDIPSDGEFGKVGWTGYAASRFSGCERVERRQPPPTAALGRANRGGSLSDANNRKSA